MNVFAEIDAPTVVAAVVVVAVVVVTDVVLPIISVFS